MGEEKQIQNRERRAAMFINNCILLLHCALSLRVEPFVWRSLLGEGVEHKHVGSKPNIGGVQWHKQWTKAAYTKLHLLALGRNLLFTLHA